MDELLWTANALVLQSANEYHLITDFASLSRIDAFNVSLSPQINNLTSKHEFYFFFKRVERIEPYSSST